MYVTHFCHRPSQFILGWRCERNVSWNIGTTLIELSVVNFNKFTEHYHKDGLSNSSSLSLGSGPKCQGRHHFEINLGSVTTVLHFLHRLGFAARIHRLEHTDRHSPHRKLFTKNSRKLKMFSRSGSISRSDLPSHLSICCSCLPSGLREYHTQVKSGLPVNWKPATTKTGEVATDKFLSQ